MQPTSADPHTPSRPVFKFCTPAGRALCRQIISQRAGYDPHDYQLDGVTRALDGADLLAVTPTGSGKTGFLTMFLLVMHTVTADPSLCSSALPSHFRPNATMIVTCPTLALQDGMAAKFTLCGLRPLVINATTLDHALREELPRKLWREVPDHDVLIVTPEQLISKGFETLLQDMAYQSRVAAMGVDEVHLLTTWGTSFRTKFLEIGSTRMRFRLHNPPLIIALTATLLAGEELRLIRASLGLVDNHKFYLLRRSNARHDLRIVLRIMSSPVLSSRYPELDWVLTENCNILIFCRTFKVSHRVHSYLTSKLASSSASSVDQVRSYNGLNWDSYNTATYNLLQSQPPGTTNHTVTVATDRLSIGVDLHSVDHVVLFECDLPKDISSVKQQEGRARDGRGRNSCVIVYLPRN
ncbi:P-loop containing nucleoside triphosphate hydrolase protein, partial [Epithele typhae]|uniref:P-loop containing nucleoside triphosphate hydrolase protein n=1 Tax=Epithele typhae TaxID=378194 RepID=UPI002007413C